MEVFERHQDGALVIAPRGRIDSTTSATLDERLQRRVAGGDRRFVVDFAQVEYISSAGLRVVLALARRLRDAQGSLVLCGLIGPVRQVFELAGFIPLFTIEATLDLAIARVTAR
jgi:anti-anti-sigma factor